jgi:hypothetical protein
MEKQSTPPVIAPNRDAFLNSLFTGPKTADGYVIKRYKRRVDVFLAGQTVSVNTHLCWIQQCKENKHWFFANIPQWGILALDEAAQSLVTGCEWKNGELLRSFN